MFWACFEFEFSIAEYCTLIKSYAIEVEHIEINRKSALKVSMDSSNTNEKEVTKKIDIAHRKFLATEFHGVFNNNKKMLSMHRGNQWNQQNSSD